jgi:hypothetical protein
MKTIQLSLLIPSCVVLATGMLAQTPPHSQHHPTQQATPQKPQSQNKTAVTKQQMMMRCRMMMEKHNQMQTDMKAMDTKLDGLVATMNAATGPKKVEATAAVVNALVTQRKAMHEKMSSMQTGMMAHMMEHMQMGKDSMSMCPMMQQMHASQKASSTPDDHTKHH